MKTRETAMKQESPANDVRGVKLLFLCASLLLLVSAVVCLSKSMRFLVGAIPDDAFYYLKIAQNYAQSGRSSFDGINPTNGYHPAWMFQLAFLSKVVGGGDALVRAALGLAFFWHFATSFFVVQILRTWLPDKFAWIGGSCWLVCANFLIVAMTAVEASFYIFCLALALCVFLKWINEPLSKPGSGPGVVPLLGFGLSLGLATLARTEMVIVIGLAAVAMITMVVRNTQLKSRFLVLARAFLTVGAAALVAVGPWLAFSKSQVGSISQDSGLMKILWAGLEHSKVSTLHRLATATAGTGKVALVWPVYFASGRQPAGVALAALLGLALLYVLIRRRDLLSGTWLWMLVASLLIAAYYQFYSSAVQGWYVALPGFVLFVVAYGVAVKWFLASKAAADPKKANAFTAVAFGLFLAGYASFTILTPRPYWDQVHLLDSALKFEQEVPAGSTVACMNAGIPGYFSTRVRIVNVDGLVNHNIVPYWQERRFDEYFKDNKIQYFSDAKSWLDEVALPFSKAPLKLEQIDFWPPNKRGLWRIVE